MANVWPGGVHFLVLFAPLPSNTGKIASSCGLDSPGMCPLLSYLLRPVGRHSFFSGSGAQRGTTLMGSGAVDLFNLVAGPGCSHRHHFSP